MSSRRRQASTPNSLCPDRVYPHIVKRHLHLSASACALSSGARSSCAVAQLKPLSRSFTDSLVELGNAASPTREGYRGVALSLIDSLDTLAVLGNVSEFHWAVEWVGKHVSFDQARRTVHSAH
eukprot:3013154-Pleurochrysis_carterae.AAC.4